MGQSLKHPNQEWQVELAFSYSFSRTRMNLFIARNRTERDDHQ